MKTPITKVNKENNQETKVSVKEFLDFIGTGAKKREIALETVLEGGLVQNMKEMYFIKELRGNK